MTPAYRRVRMYLITAFTAFFAMSIICILIRPDLFDHPDYGLSFFGSIRNTLVPYIAGLLTIVYCLWAIARELRPFKQADVLRRIYIVGAATMLGIVLTPMALHPVVWWTHIAIGFVLLFNLLFATAWILLRKGTPLLDYLIGAALLASGTVTVLSGTWPGVLGVCALGEMGVFATGVLLLGRAALRTVKRNPA